MEIFIYQILLRVSKSISHDSFYVSQFVESLFGIFHAMSITRHVCGVYHMSRVTSTRLCAWSNVLG